MQLPMFETETTTEKMNFSTLLSMIDDVPLFRAMDEEFSRMEIVEDEIEKARIKHGEVERGPLWNSFMACKPSELFYTSRYSDNLYRAHVREILDRVAIAPDKPKALEPATDAEVMILLIEASLRAPLTHDYFIVYATLFHKRFSYLAAKTFGSIELPVESWPGRTEELLGEIRRKMTIKRGHDEE